MECRRVPFNAGEKPSGMRVGLAEEKLPVLVHHLLNLVQVLVGEVSETPLELEVLADEVFPGLVVDGITDAVFHFIEREDIRLHGHTGDLDGHLRGNAPARGTARKDMDETGTCLLYTSDAADE